MSLITARSGRLAYKCTTKVVIRGSFWDNTRAYRGLSAIAATGDRELILFMVKRRSPWKQIYRRSPAMIFEGLIQEEETAD
ncbi:MULTISPECIES: hypothetical protein [unclassified Microcoleus]|uniref:hypothetical protein n=1 Tax=unclassified Microcoleus TaxID=2642155 RepID=UPI002FD28035